MATPSRRIVKALRDTADNILQSKDYQWGHMGACNCGYLAQTVTHLSKGEIHAYAMRKSGDWSEQVQDYCPTSGMPFDLLISEMLNAGFSREDLIELERLSNKEVLELLPVQKRYLNHNQKMDVVLYMQIWADLLEKQLPSEQQEIEVLEEEMIIF